MNALGDCGCGTALIVCFNCGEPICPHCDDPALCEFERAALGADTPATKEDANE